MASEIIGRREELVSLEAFLDAVAAGGQALLLESDAVIGKTALWEEALRVARGREVCVLRSPPTQSEAQARSFTTGDHGRE